VLEFEQFVSDPAPSVYITVATVGNIVRLFLEPTWRRGDCVQVLVDKHVEHMFGSRKRPADIIKSEAESCIIVICACLSVLLSLLEN